LGKPTPVPSVLPTVAHPLRMPDAVAAVQSCSYVPPEGRVEVMRSIAALSCQ
jgi:hypothetical protein